MNDPEVFIYSEDEDEVGFKLIMCRPVWVRSRPICRFPVGDSQGVVVDHQTVCSSHPVGTEVMNPALGTGPVCVPYGRS